MIRQLWSRFFWTAAVAAALGLAAQASAKPPDLPVNTNNTVAPEVLPDGEWDGKAPLPGDREVPQLGNAEACDLWLNRPAFIGLTPSGQIAVFPVSGAAPANSATAPMAIIVPSVGTTLPLLAQLPPVERRQFASMLLFGVHPLLTLVPTDKLVDMACDHPPCERPADAPIVGMKNDDAIHGRIEIGIGFTMQGQPTYKFHVVEFTDKGTVYTDDTLQGCVEALIRALNREATNKPQPAHGAAEESSNPPRPAKRAIIPEDQDYESLLRPLEQGDSCLLVESLWKSSLSAYSQELTIRAAQMANQWVSGPGFVDTDLFIWKDLTEEFKLMICPLNQYSSVQPQGAEESSRDEKQAPPMCPYMRQPMACPGWPLPQEEPIFQKAMAKPYRETNNCPAGVGKGD